MSVLYGANVIDGNDEVLTDELLEQLDGDDDEAEEAE